MTNGVHSDIPCPKVPSISKIPSINFLGMAELKGNLDFSMGTPRDCTLSINLMLQLAPLMASMTCLLRILAVIQAMEKFVKSPLTETQELLAKLGEVAGCFKILAPPTVGLTIKSVLELVINFLSCFIEQLKSLITFHASIDLASAENNPVLKATLECAKENAQVSINNHMMALEPLKPLFEMSKSLAGVVGLNLELPDVAGLSKGPANAAVIEDIEAGIKKIKDAINALPG